MTHRYKALPLIFIALAAPALQADVTLNRLFSNGMVIQRDTEAPVWGWADPGEAVSVNASWGEKAQTIAAKDGTWSIKLKTPEAGGPHTIQIEGNNTIDIKDVLSGEVWFCSGQSNMDFPMKSISNSAKEPKYQSVSDYVSKEIQTANDPLLRHIEVPNTPSPTEAKTNFEGQWNSVSPEHTGTMTATGYFFARELRKQLNVPVGLVECAWGGTRVQPWISEEAYRSRPDLRAYYEKEMATFKKLASTWDLKLVDERHKKAMATRKKNGKKGRAPRKPVDPALNRQLPATLHKGMVSAVQPYAIKGAIWYQGESNAGYMLEDYEDHFSTMITSWRKEWNQGDFPFYWVQLANFRKSNADPLETDGWSSICDQQRRCLALPNTGMAVINDIGEVRDIHPRNKPDVGKRLAAWALAKDYGIDLPAHSGPLYKSHTIKGDTVTIRFDEVGSGLMVGHKELMNATVEVDEPLKRFQIAGADRVWKWANATIVSKDSITVSHPEVSNPVVVRYAWSSNPEGSNLYNKEGFPTSIFTTE